MTFRPPGPRNPRVGRPIVLPRWPRYVVPAVLIVLVAAILIAVIGGILTDYLWFSSVGQTEVFSTTFITKWLLFAVVAAFMVVVIGANLMLAYRLRPDVPPSGPEHQGVEAYRQAIDPRRRVVTGILLGLIGLISGLTATGTWQTVLLFLHRMPFGVQDPQFHLDVSFFVFDYPFVRTALSFLFAAVLLALILSAAVHVLYGGLRLGRHPRASTGARVQLFVLAGIFVALKAVAYWVDRYGINFSQRGVVRTGASYTDVHAVLPAKTVLAVIAIICAGLFFAGAARRSSLLPGIGFGLLVLSAVIIGGVYPFIVQQFVVRPNEQVKERPYIQREIASTQVAYGLTHLRVISYPAIGTGKPAQLTTAAANLPDLRLTDPSVVPVTFQQLQQVKTYYQFSGVLAMDRYQIGSHPVPQDMVVGVRDMAGPPGGQTTWINTHLVYTHGYGLVSAAAAAAQANGNPQFTEGNIPPAGQLPPFQPRVYFGHEGVGYVIAPTRQPELDYPNASASGQRNTSYAGDGGVSAGSFWRRLLFAVRFRDLNIMLSGAIEPNSRILYIRDPLARVAKVAPFLTLDGDPYPVVAGGQILWVVDGYTTTDNYPYSQRVDLGQATSNTYSPGGLSVGPATEVNYIRNSVKATVNAYTGAVHLYQWGGAPNPVLRAWMSIFPGLISPQRDIPAALLPHLRYPEGLFDVQRQILAQYHLASNQPTAFYSGQNFWSVPLDPTVPSRLQITQPPYYLTLTMPGLAGPNFSLVTPFTQRNRPNLAAFLAVDSKPGPGYGSMTVLELSQNGVIPGPTQVHANFESAPNASEPLTLLRRGGSNVTLGNLVTVPFAGGFLYVEPVYVAAANTASGGSYPQLKELLTYFYGGQQGILVGFAPTLDAALAQTFGSVAAANPSSPTGPTGKVNAQVLILLRLAQRYYAQAQAALHASPPDFTLYGQDIAKMKLALDQAQRAAQGATAHPSPSGSPSPSPSP